MERLGDRVSQLIGHAREEVILVAPYIKVGALRKALTALSDDVVNLTCVTRWLPEDIAAGVCDLDILNTINSSPGGKLLVHPHLHAKYYRADAQCLIGSANLTSRALGWTTPANIELLVEVPHDFPGVKAWEQNVLSSAIEATMELQSQIAQEADLIRSRQEIVQVPEVETDEGDIGPVNHWVPRCPVPDRLWDVYSGAASATAMLQSTRDAANEDLKALKPPLGLNKPLFEAYVPGILKQMPLVLAIDDLASRGLADTEAYDFLESQLGSRALYSPQQTWEILKSWLVYFMGSSYRVETREDVLVKGQRITRPDL